MTPLASFRRPECVPPEHAGQGACSWSSCQQDHESGCLTHTDRRAHEAVSQAGRLAAQPQVNSAGASGHQLTRPADCWLGFADGWRLGLEGSGAQVQSDLPRGSLGADVMSGLLGRSGQPLNIRLVALPRRTAATRTNNASYPKRHRDSHRCSGMACSLHVARPESRSITSVLKTYCLDD